MSVKKLVENYCELPRGLRPVLWRAWHAVLNRVDMGFSARCLNYGYASPNGEFEGLALGTQESSERFGIQLYAHVTAGARLENAAVLEVGCGRGGGAAFLTRLHRPKEYIALDISHSLMLACSRVHVASGLRFVQGSAEALPFENARFDAVINVESARCYGNLGEFFAGVFRVLKPGGHFFFVDMMKNGDVERVHALLQHTGFAVVRQKDIRENVVLALQLDAESRRQRINRFVPGWLRPSFYEFAGVEGSNRFEAFREAALQYRSYTLQKPMGI